MEEQTAVETPPAPQVPAQTSVEQKPQDLFSLDENALVSLSPEQRAGLEPILESWKKRATEEISKKESEVVSKYKPLEEKATALDKLTQYQPFVSWWTEQQKVAAQGATAQERQSISQTKPQDVASQQEWQEAVYEASQGNGEKLQNIQQRMMSLWATPLVRDITARQQKIDAQLELRDLFESHPDAKDLDAIGLDPKTKEGTSLLEMALDWAERNGKPYEEGYELARKWSDSMTVGAQQRAMGLVNEKKGSVTQGPSTSSVNQNIVEVASADELIKRSLEAQISGQKDVRFVIKGSK